MYILVMKGTDQNNGIYLFFLCVYANATFSFRIHFNKHSDKSFFFSCYKVKQDSEAQSHLEPNT